MNQRTSRSLMTMSIAVAPTAIWPGVARADWGSEVWGQMQWDGSIPVPLLHGEGALALGLLMALSGFWLARHVHKRLLAMATDQHGG